jgi:molecular chaperone Hsp33
MFNMQDRDLRQRFLFENLSVRGELVHLNQSWQEILKRSNYPESIQTVLGDMAAAAVLLSATLKFNGSLIMQIQGTGPLTMLVMEATSQSTLRGLAQWQGDVEAMGLLEMVGEPTLIITINPDQGERYQGIVDLTSGNIAQALENYMIRSQQIQTRIWLYSDSVQASGMLLQKMPSLSSTNQFSEVDDDGWPRITLLADTVRKEEISELDFSSLLRRLFHEEDVRIFEKTPVSFRCSCTRDRVIDMLRMLGYDEVKSIIEEKDRVEVRCQFCNHYYGFDVVDVEQLFASDIRNAITSTRQ